MDVSDAICPTPPRREPRNAVMLINDEVERFLLSIPSDRAENRTAFAAGADDLDAIDCFAGCGAGKMICEPGDFMAATDERVEVTERHPFSSAGERAFRVAPVKHQKTHECKVCVYGGKRHAERLWLNLS